MRVSSSSSSSSSSWKGIVFPILAMVSVCLLEDVTLVNGANHDKDNGRHDHKNKHQNKHENKHSDNHNHNDSITVVDTNNDIIPISISTIPTIPTISTTISTSTSCKDEDEYFYNSNPSKSCSWVSRSPSSRCELVDSSTFIQIKDKCRKSCDNCMPSNGTKRQVGQYCSRHEDCTSNICRSNTCYQTKNCKPIKHELGQTFHSDKIILVFVGSNFDDINEWRTQVLHTYRAFHQTTIFRNDNQSFHAFYVDSINQGESICDYGCRGVDTLLCCQESRAKQLAQQCFPTQTSTLQTIVIHDDTSYGGAGYRSSNVATTSRHQDGGLVAVHELGHSLFELGDEYTEGGFTAKNSANCDYASCPKWTDLEVHFGKKQSMCKPGYCKGGGYYIAQESFMEDITKPIGHVNLRYTCCTFLALTKSLPSYCQDYDFGKGLVQYCRNDYQNYVDADHTVEDVYRLQYPTYTPDNYNNKHYHHRYGSSYLLVDRPKVILLDVKGETYTLVKDQDGEKEEEEEEEGPAIRPKGQLMGDYRDILEANRAGEARVLKLTIHFVDSNNDSKRFYRLPSGMDFFLGDDDATSVQSIDGDGSSSRTAIMTTMMEIVIDGEGEIDDISFERIEITKSLVARERFGAFVSSIFFGIGLSCLILGGLAFILWKKRRIDIGNGDGGSDSSSDESDSTTDEEGSDGENAKNESKLIKKKKNTTTTAKQKMKKSNHMEKRRQIVDESC